MAIIQLAPQAKATLVAQLQIYLEDQHDIDIGQFDCEFLLDFVTEKAAGHWYNQGLEDARGLMHAMILSSLDDGEEAVDSRKVTLD
ncbi:DUF2164 domain-containing protein [Shewanella sp. NIFS-20-20]|uniref:DUF2164 domain-containing protein n=1 Tax=Shewanella sp. NIFS-20-20 TaxID=2853806 RepID=UPI001C445192|nr:DUF2164 domain-containing protein [Shewanella sp. NIFS-20-20]MBV7315905.1 DUF2164 domain-containing protein [Shewanella sp. NIFS-20-20]